jgi:hypothetical protein
MDTRIVLTHAVTLDKDLPTERRFAAGATATVSEQEAHVLIQAKHASVAPAAKTLEAGAAPIVAPPPPTDGVSETDVATTDGTVPIGVPATLHPVIVNDTAHGAEPVARQAPAKRVRSKRAAAKH